MAAFGRPALGEQHRLSALYDARRERFLSTSLYPDGPPEEAFRVEWQAGRKVSLCGNASVRARIDAFNLSETLAASCLAGLLDLHGASEYLKPPEHNSADELHYSLTFISSTILQELLLGQDEQLESIAHAVISQDRDATHVVTQVLWGASCTATATGRVSDEIKRQETARRFREAVQKVDNSVNKELSLNELLSIADNVLNPDLFLRTHSDLIPPKSPPLTTLPEITAHLEKIFDLAQSSYDEAQPLSYVLTPISSLFRRSDFDRTMLGMVPQMSSTNFATAIELCDRYTYTRHSLQDYHERLKKHKAAVSADYRADVGDKLDEVKAAESQYRQRFSILLCDLRDGKVLEERLTYFLMDCSDELSSALRLLSVADYSTQKMDLIDMIQAGGGRCESSRTLDENSLHNSAVLYFSKTALNHESWQRNLDLVRQTLSDHSAEVVTVDCDSGPSALDSPRVAKFKNGKCKIPDIIDHLKQEAGLSFIKFDRGSTDPSVKEAPSQRKPVKVPCPGGLTCGRDDRDWVCFKCRVKVEYGVVDSFLYCECGRAQLQSATYNCQQGHGDQYTRYPYQYLHKLLEGLPSPPETNILILGETGVGKSTFINSFINYLSFNQLDDALANKHLNWIIPCSFATQDEGEDGRLIQKEVKIGKDEDEHDGSKGSSATQQATVYPVYYGGGLVRLIDTPGIGDTRGPDQDRQNMINILRVLRNYEKLHGILILLKPNNARLTIMFKFCIKELLTQLHRNAAQNMVFGFTNTRGSNYQPGDTFQPLEHLLKEYKDVIPGLFKETVYCFDSESFRYLAARYKGIDMGHIDDYRRSWDHSAHEARRMVAYFQKKIPHEVQNTVSLNETRYLITQLIQPMAQITTAIADTVKQSDDKIKDLHDTELTGTQLRAKLSITKTVIDSIQLDKPRTVCSNSRCCTLTSSNNDTGQSVTLFKSRCHAPCYLTDVPPNQIGAKEIPPCAAFAGAAECKVCGHHWSEHQHVVVEYRERTEKSTDPTVQNALNRNLDDKSLKQNQIDALKRLIKELNEEHQMIQESQARFSHYLQQHSITHYNDATIEYFDHLIKDERSKVSRGLSRSRLDQLENDKTSYANFVRAMKLGRSTKTGGPLDENGVHDLVKRLFAMKHYGKNLHDCAKKTGQAYSATFRERPYRVRQQGARDGVSQKVGSIVSAIKLTPRAVEKQSWDTPSSNPSKGKLVKALPFTVKPAKVIPGAFPGSSVDHKHDVLFGSDSHDNRRSSISKPNHPSTPPQSSPSLAQSNSLIKRKAVSTSSPTTQIPSQVLFPHSDDEEEEDEYLGGKFHNHQHDEDDSQPPMMVTQRSAGQRGVHNQWYEEDEGNFHAAAQSSAAAAAAAAAAAQYPSPPPYQLTRTADSSRFAAANHTGWSEQQYQLPFGPNTVPAGSTLTLDGTGSWTGYVDPSRGRKGFMGRIKNKLQKR